jgi:dipeptidyl aminopeptidase/acylaminoacyl peptidase
VLFLRDTALMAQPFDAARLALAGEPVPVPGVERIGTTPYGYGRFTTSFNGTLVYSTGDDSNASRITWFDRQGKTLGTIGQRGIFNALALSPDGTRVAAERRDTAGSDLWLIESKSGGKSERFTFDPGNETAPVWAPDGSRVVYASSRGGGFNLYQKLSNLAGNEEELFRSGEVKFPSDWSRDGRFLLFTAVGAKMGADLWSLSMEGEHKTTAFLQMDFDESRGRLSPDGRWLAYASAASGRGKSISGRSRLRRIGLGSGWSRAPAGISPSGGGTERSCSITPRAERWRSRSLQALSLNRDSPSSSSRSSLLRSRDTDITGTSPPMDSDS